MTGSVKVSKDVKCIIAAFSLIVMAALWMFISSRNVYAAEIVDSGDCGADGSNVTWTFDDEGLLTISGNGAMADYTEDGAPWNSQSSDIISVYIDDGVTSIGTSAFYYCFMITSITIPDSVTSIGESAFNGCSSLTSITIPNSVTSIGYAAFKGCSSLTSITIPEGVTSIETSTFSGCRSLTSITIPEGVTSIGLYAFTNCSSITSITIPDRVTSIEYCAFSDCISLTDVYYSGTEDEWNAIDIDDGNKYLTGAAIHYKIPSDNMVVAGGSYWIPVTVLPAQADDQTVIWSLEDYHDDTYDIDRASMVLIPESLPRIQQEILL
ncbi:MAG: leucine-rich repeat domain-containing protein [Lachnospiraceae bacterium]|nr:leucine-rich repeat domain-containing protein [Lachnospiraceae bacterium]